jgi:rhodanese-related sulfurtransferase
VDFFIKNWPLFLVAFTSGAFLLYPVVKKCGGNTISTAEAVRLINRENGVLVDVSESEEFAAGHAGGARNVPLGQLESSKDLPSNKALPLIVLCPNGARANRAVGILKKLGYEQARSVAGGTAAWREATLPIERKAAA